VQAIRKTHIVVEDLLHAEKLGEKLGDEGEGRADAEVGDARPDPGEDCEKMRFSKRFWGVRGSAAY